MDTTVIGGLLEGIDPFAMPTITETRLVAAQPDPEPMPTIQASPPPRVTRTAWTDHIWLWAPTCVATGHGPAARSPRLTGTQIAVYLTLLARADNATQLYRVARPREVSQRCGITAATLQVHIRHLAEAGLLTIEQQGSGRPTVVRVVRGTARNHHALPEAALWPDPWPSPPRWNHRNLGPAVRSLYALLHTLDHPKRERPRVTTTRPARFIAKGAGLALSKYNAGLATLLAHSTPGGWVISTVRHYGGEDGVLQDTSLITLDWTRLPAAAKLPAPPGAASESSSPVVHVATDPASSECGIEVGGHEPAANPVQPAETPPAPNSGDFAAQVLTAMCDTGDPTLDVTLDTAAASGLRPALNNEGRRGWHPVALAHALTATPLTGARSLPAVLRTRLHGLHREVPGADEPPRRRTSHGGSGNGGSAAPSFVADVLAEVDALPSRDNGWSTEVAIDGVWVEERIAKSVLLRRALVARPESRQQDKEAMGAYGLTIAPGHSPVNVPDWLKVYSTVERELAFAERQWGLAQTIDPSYADGPATIPL